MDQNNKNPTLTCKRTLMAYPHSECWLYSHNFFDYFNLLVFEEVDVNIIFVNLVESSKRNILSLCMTSV
jgi:hypothetical protein